jgi:RNA polymerase sigma-70 factor (ECF subfamily)
MVPRWGGAPLRPLDETYSRGVTSGIYPIVHNSDTPPAVDERTAGAKSSRAQSAQPGDQRGSQTPGHDEKQGHDPGKPRGETSDAPLNVVYRECAPAIHRMMLRLGIPERYAEDATNDVFVTALPRWNEFRGDSSRRTWLFGFAIKVAANQRRKLGRAGEESALAVAHDFDASPSGTVDPFEHASARQAMQQLESLLDTLTLEERALWLLVYYEDVSVHDAAEIVGMSAPKAYVLAKWVHAKLVKAWKRNNPPDAWRTW